MLLLLLFFDTLRVFTFCLLLTYLARKGHGRELLELHILASSPGLVLVLDARICISW
jgi:hypothetical protein